MLKQSSQQKRIGERGFIRLIIVIIIIILVLSFFKINLKTIVESDTAKTNFSYVWDGLKAIWYDFIVPAGEWIIALPTGQAGLFNKVF